MNARDVLDGLRSVEWSRFRERGGYDCPVCKGAQGPTPEEGHDDGCALAAAIRWFDEHVGAETARLAEHCDSTMCKQWGNENGDCDCPCAACVDADVDGRHQTLPRHHE